MNAQLSDIVMALAELTVAMRELVDTLRAQAVIVSAAAPPAVPAQPRRAGYSFDVV